MKWRTFGAVTQVLFALLWTPAAVQNPGFVTGLVRSSAGAPAANVRVYAFSFKDVAEAANGVPALESQTTTDASGRYRLELPPGRYYIAAGSVSNPTYFPGTSDPAASRVITVATGEATANIDFASFVAAPLRPGLASAPVGTGVISGVIRYPDGKPATNITVAVSPTSTPSSPGAALTLPNLPSISSAMLSVMSILAPNRALTDNTGRYLINRLSPDTYYIVAGYAENPSFYPATQDVTAAKTITTTPTTRIDTLDMTIPTQPAGTVLSGHALSISGLAAPDVGVTLRPQSAAQPIQTYGLPIRSSRRDVVVGSDGSFQFRDVAPGTYSLEAAFSGVTLLRKPVSVQGIPLTDLELRVPVARISGRILM